MTRTIITCDVCGRDMSVSGERYTIDARVRHQTDARTRRGFCKVDMCPVCYDGMVEFCKCKEAK